MRGINMRQWSQWDKLERMLRHECQCDYVLRALQSCHCESEGHVNDGRYEICIMRNHYRDGL